LLKLFQSITSLLLAEAVAAHQRMTGQVARLAAEVEREAEKLERLFPLMLGRR
jgi:hypothetical protein